MKILKNYLKFSFAKLKNFFCPELKIFLKLKIKKKKKLKAIICAN